MSDATILIRWYQIVCPDAAAPALLAQLRAIPTAQQGEFNLSEPAGPEAAPGAGVSNTITHRVDGPSSAEATFQAARALVLAHPGALIQDTRWRVLDGNEIIHVDVEHSGEPMALLGLHFYDETY